MLNWFSLLCLSFQSLCTITQQKTITKKNCCLAPHPPCTLSLLNVRVLSFVCLFFQYASGHLCQGHNINWEIQPKDPISSMSPHYSGDLSSPLLWWHCVQRPRHSRDPGCGIHAIPCLPPSRYSFSDTSSIFFYLPGGDVCWNHYREPSPREGKELERKKVLKGTCWLLVAIKTAIALTTLSPTTLPQTSAQLCSRSAWPFLQGPSFRMGHSPRKASFWHYSQKPHTSCLVPMLT